MSRVTEGVTAVTWLKYCQYGVILHPINQSTVSVARWRTLNAQWPWVSNIGQNLQAFTGNGDVSIWVENSSRMGWKTPNNKPSQNPLPFIQIDLKHFILQAYGFDSRYKKYCITLSVMSKLTLVNFHYFAIYIHFPLDYITQSFFFLRSCAYVLLKWTDENITDRLALYGRNGIRETHNFMV